MLNVLILEDEEYTRKYMKKILIDLPHVDTVIDTGNATEAIGLFQKYRPDINILDIELFGQELNGLEVAKQIYEVDKKAQLLFVTGYTRYAVESYAVHPYSYVVKPIVNEYFVSLIKEIIDSILYQRQQQQDHLVVKSKRNVIHLLKKKIIFIEKLNGHSLVHSYDGKYEFTKTLDELEQLLGSDFLRVHRSFIINMNHVKKISEIYDRSYEIEFNEYLDKAQMSRYQYSKYKKLYYL